MKPDTVMRFLGVNSKAPPAKLLGFRSDPRDIEAVEAALGRQVRKVNVHPDGDSADADAVRRKLREAARILTGPLSSATPPTIASPRVARARPETTTLPGSTPGWTPRGASPQKSIRGVASEHEPHPKEPGPACQCPPDVGGLKLTTPISGGYRLGGRFNHDGSESVGLKPLKFALEAVTVAAHARQQIRQ